jgi:hypothetical protein
METASSYPTVPDRASPHRPRSQVKPRVLVTFDVTEA